MHWISVLELRNACRRTMWCERWYLVSHFLTWPLPVLGKHIQTKVFDSTISLRQAHSNKGIWFNDKTKHSRYRYPHDYMFKQSDWNLWKYSWSFHKWIQKVCRSIGFWKQSVAKHKRTGSLKQRSIANSCVFTSR